MSKRIPNTHNSRVGQYANTQIQIIEEVLALALRADYLIVLHNVQNTLNIKKIQAKERQRRGTA